MHKSRLGVVVIDCQSDDLRADAAFWGGALGAPAEEGGGSEEDPYIKLGMPDDEIMVLMQAVSHPSRVHLDIETDDIAAEVRRLERLGAKQVAAVKTWVVMEAPSGQRFCVVNPQRADFDARARVWPDEDDG